MIHFHRWRYWKDPDGEGPMYWGWHFDIDTGATVSAGVDRRTCVKCHKVQRFNYVGSWIIDYWKTIGQAIPEARAR